GLGAVATVNAYKPLTDGSVYSKDHNAVLPAIDIQPPMYVASSSSSSNGIGGTLTTNYKYAGMKADTTGRGLLGFTVLDTTQVESGASTHTEFRQDWPYIGIPMVAEQKVASGGNGGLISYTTSAPLCVNPATGGACATAPGNRYFPFVAQTVSDKYDLDGTLLPRVVTTNSYDLFGNATQSSVWLADGSSKTTTNVYASDTTNWILGMLTRSTVTSSTNV